MSVAEIDTTEVREEPTITGRIADVVRQAAHCSHEARLVRSMARDAGENGVHAAKRLIKRVRRTAESLQDVKDEAAHYVRRHPFKSVGVAAAVGLVTGVAVGSIAVGVGRR